ncbi:Na+/H+ antiporter NhaC family protein [Vibrio stylophorae]|uniref:Na+/H+ antiporter NhaC family protein n=1 Tax=Vibrio stylophorae TaxID=659351 RepID=UPI003F4A50B1
MSTHEYINTVYSVIPPVVALILVLFTRRVLLSLGVGILCGAYFYAEGDLWGAFKYLDHITSALFVNVDGGNTFWSDKVSILIFLICLGVMTALMTLSGGTRAFAQWAQRKIKNRRGAKMMSALLGVFIFIDDYFNSLAVGAISRPVTDQFKVSRAKLAYILDSTAAPMCVIMPASSWGAYIITQIADILEKNHIHESSPLGTFVTMIPMNFYAIFALLMVLAVAWFQIDIGPMRRHERLALQGTPVEAQEGKNQEEIEIKESSQGHVADLVMPVVVLVIATIGAMMWTGAQAMAADGRAFTVLGAFENTSVTDSLLYSGIIGVLAALVGPLRQRLPRAELVHAISMGTKSMFGAILILLFAWSISTVIDNLQTGAYLSGLVMEHKVGIALMPLIFFTLSGFMAFATGTSWGTFGLMLPIAGSMAAASAANDPTTASMVLPMLASVLAGSVFGDHCSPISDTTILSSTGARCCHIDHVMTQLPYALSIALISMIGYGVLGFTESTFAGFMTCTVLFIAWIVFLLIFNKRHPELEEA